MHVHAHVYNNSGFSIEGGTRRLIATYSVHVPWDLQPLSLLKSLFFSLFCSASSLELFPNCSSVSSVSCTTVIQTRLGNLLTVLDLIDKAILLQCTGLQGETWERVCMLQNGSQASHGAERTYQIIWLLAKRIKESLRFKILLCLDVEIVFFLIL